MIPQEKLILGIESSCDDTAIALVASDGKVLYSNTLSQDSLHTQFGGVYPEYASRAHVENIIGLVHGAVSDLGVSPKDLEAIAVTRGPGLIGSLIVGNNLAAGLGIGWNVEVIGVNHLRGHLKSAELETSVLEYPAVVLLISGGHTFLTLLQSKDDVQILGTTRDDSVGEAFDKVGRMLGLGYPAGKEMDELSLKGIARIAFPKPMLHSDYEFSFSGLKSSVARYLEVNKQYIKEDVAASFVKSVVDVLIFKCEKAINEYQPNTLAIVGGVAASPIIRDAAQSLCQNQNVKLALPPQKWATDNAAMIAYLGWDYIDRSLHIDPIPNVNLKFEDY